MEVRLRARCARARTHALSELVASEKSDAFEHGRDLDSQVSAHRELISWVKREGFNQVDREILEPSMWRVCWAARLRHAENILASEGRAWLWSLRHQLRGSNSFRRRILQLVDNMPLCLAINKGRGRSAHLTRVLQRGAALLLCTGSSASARWVPSELNLADDPSRFRPSRSYLLEASRPLAAAQRTDGQGVPDPGPARSPLVVLPGVGVAPSTKYVPAPRAAAIGRTAPAREDLCLPGKTFLERRSIGQSMGVDYLRKLFDFRQWLRQNGEPISSPELLDGALTRFFDQLYFQGYSSQYGEKMMAAVMFAIPAAPRSRSTAARRWSEPAELCVLGRSCRPASSGSRFPGLA